MGNSDERKGIDHIIVNITAWINIKESDTIP